MKSVCSDSIVRNTLRANFNKLTSNFTGAEAWGTEKPRNYFIDPTNSSFFAILLLLLLLISFLLLPKARSQVKMSIYQNCPIYVYYISWLVRAL